MTHETWYRNIDTTFIGLEYEDSETRKYHLCPYSSETVKQALSLINTKKRIEIIDDAILTSLKL